MGKDGGPRAGRPSTSGRGVGRVLAGLAVPAVLLVVWHVAAVAGWISPVTLPGPLAVLDAAAGLIERGDLALHIAISTQRVILGFLFGAAAGLALGALLGLSRVADTLLSTSIGALRAVPSLAWVPLLLLWIGIGEDSKVTLVAIGAFFPVFTTVSMALRHVDTQLVEAGRAFGLRGLTLFTTVQLPAVVPSVISGLRLALAQAWLFLVAAELLASSIGLGFLLTDSQNNGRVDRLLLAIVLLAILGTLTDALLRVFERWAIRRWA
ncbi:ABC transporter permease [Georgenia halophila]|uniref:ABC transporter permease n=1 Tax=Georgenia halophila TaxID=620889 RepID=UPI0031EBD78D